MVETPLFFLALGFGLGLLHALDGDHLIAVSGMAGTDGGWGRSLSFCISWAIGHGLVLMLIGGAVLLLGMTIPDDFSRWAENLVGLVLILIGLWVLHDLSRYHLPLSPHTHPGRGNPPQKEKDQHQHWPILVGMIHGTSGSAPLLALIPVVSTSNATIGMVYLLTFSLGVFLAMLMVGSLLGRLFSWSQARSKNLLSLIQGVAGLTSLGYGFYLISQLG
jgi:sulfite exporter TauE/SafE